MLQYQSFTRRESLPSKVTPAPIAAYGRNHADVLRSLANYDYDIAASKAAADYSDQYQQAQQSTALSGLRQMNTDQDTQRSLYNSRLQNMLGIYSGLLSGLNR